ncbi:serine carboxypeptidase [Stereum hirsutum FP-91666 SS1]|uniref:serine carboxypeptidase n=1 Tax=Stereum hirsutum (strain FP-91666) TaxID=721885 RepID=UPI000444A6E8|nr:serine carboxypeptidase [Stereum hirsutum FP-91666 SS1]EIM82008.1 serine carboxypeptidase [Stereum hirsutum FP-91666 SS1]
MISAVVLVTTALVWPIHVLSGQIPVVDGVIGGIPSTPNALEDSVIESTSASAPTPGKLRVTENSGICETTPGVYQASGYGDISANESIWFWFFEARNNPETAPLVTWFNGGPGSSSMIGLLQELGPCRISNDSTTVSLNPESWNENANVMFIDQPVGVGFSYGTTTVGTSQEAASDVWEFLQIWFNDTRFSKFQDNDFAVWTESYGGHYGPTFAAHFLDQNEAIANGSISGIPLNLKALGVGDGLTDPLLQYPGYITYAASNPYHPLTSATAISRGNTSFYEVGGCQDQIQACYDTGATSTCSAAQSFCNNNILSPLAGNFDVYYVLTANPDPYPPDLTPFLTNSTIVSQIGAQAKWTQSSNTVYSNFARTGDWMHNSRPDLERVIDSGVRVLVYDGDAVNGLQTQFSATFAQQEFANFTVNGVPAGLFKNAGTFSYVRIFGAGHEVPAYEFTNVPRGAAASQFFNQIMSNQSLSGT